jgi:hypothetical protein
MIRLILSMLITLYFSPVKEKHPDCTCNDCWPASMAYVHLKDADLAGPQTLDFKKTKVKRLASEKIGDDLYRQIHLVTFKEKNGGTINVITVSDASFEECSMSDVEVYVVSRKLNP